GRGRNRRLLLRGLDLGFRHQPVVGFDLRTRHGFDGEPDVQRSELIAWPLSARSRGCGPAIPLSWARSTPSTLGAVYLFPRLRPWPAQGTCRVRAGALLSRSLKTTSPATLSALE